MKKPNMNDPVDKLAHVISEIHNDNAPIGWESYRYLAKSLIQMFGIVVEPESPETESAPRSSHCHTPGPWGVSTNGKMVVTPPPQECKRRIRDGESPFTSRRIAITENATYLTDGEVAANSRLIAAAPELIEACRAAVNCIFDLSPTQARVETMHALQEAIEKAVGEGG